MKLNAVLLVLVAGVAVMTSAQARDTKLMLPIEAAMGAGSAEGKLGDEVKFYFGDQKTPAVIKKLGTDSSNKKTNAVGKSDGTACNWAFMSAMIALEKRAVDLGANAVVNIVSYHNKMPMSSATEFECHAGAIMAGVTLKGDFVKIAGK